MKRSILMGIEGKVVVMVGGEGPLGRAVTRKFLAEGAKLVIAWNSAEEWAEAKKMIPQEKQNQVIDMKIDATQEEQVQALMKKTKETWGSIDILLHMVGLFHAGELIWEADPEILDKLLHVNLRSAFLTCKHSIKYMLEQKSGRIIVFPPRDTIEPKPRMGIYAIAKSGMVTMITALREELKGTGITINGVMPSIMDTWRTRKMPHAEPDKWVKPEEVANVIGLLCSDESAAVSGSILKVFGKL
jgi:NAD(P)-dependent dehydrogenase (short-subunit alcohol dehydrogenase family)